MDIQRIIPNLGKNESIFVFMRSYYISFLAWIGLGLLLTITGIIITSVAYFSFPEIQTNPMAFNILVVMASAYFLLMLPFLTVAFIDYYYDIHIVTNRRLIDIDQHSLFVREVNELALEEVQDVTTRNVGILSSVFDYGTVTIETASAQQKFEFDNVHKPREIAGIIIDLADQCKQRIEQGEHMHADAAPRGMVKGMINDVAYASVEPLVRMGAVKPSTKQEETNAKQQPGIEPKAAHTITIAGVPSGIDVEETPAHQPPQHVEVTNPEPIPIRPEPSASDEPNATIPSQLSETHHPQKQQEPPKPKEGDQDDLDIIIDDPQPSPKR